MVRCNVVEVSWTQANNGIVALRIGSGAYVAGKVPRIGKYGCPRPVDHNMETFYATLAVMYYKGRTGRVSLENYVTVKYEPFISYNKTPARR